MALFAAPARIEAEYGCISCACLCIPLQAGVSKHMTVLGKVEPGRSFNASPYRLLADREYLEGRDGEGTPVTHGWVQGLPGDITQIWELFAG